MCINFLSKHGSSLVVRSWLSVLLLFVFMSEVAYSRQADNVEAPGTAASDDATLGVIQRPRWEVGIGGGYFSGFDYPASSEKNERALAVPFFIYRSPAIRIGGGGVRAVAIERPRLKLDLSIGGSLNASSEGNSVRQGMPDLDFLFEVGPQLEYRLVDRSLDSGARVLGRFTGEIRAVFATDFTGVSDRGFVADVGFGLNVGNVAGSGITFISSLKASFASERLQDYFYEVDLQFVNDGRPAFDASGGYIETSLVTGFAIRPLPQVRVFAGIINGFFSGASNRNSPLFEVTKQTRFALGVVWTVKKSRHLVDIVDLGSDS